MSLSCFALVIGWSAIWYRHGADMCDRLCMLDTVDSWTHTHYLSLSLYVKWVVHHPNSVHMYGNTWSPKWRKMMSLGRICQHAHSEQMLPLRHQKRKYLNGIYRSVWHESKIDTETKNLPNNPNNLLIGKKLLWKKKQLWRYSTQFIIKT